MYANYFGYNFGNLIKGIKSYKNGFSMCIVLLLIIGIVDAKAMKAQEDAIEHVDILKKFGKDCMEMEPTLLLHKNKNNVWLKNRNENNISIVVTSS